jgi:hypothetical protein
VARLREADLRVGDRLRYALDRAATRVYGRIDRIERAAGTPAMALLTREDTGDQLIVRLGHLARYSTRAPACAVHRPAG